ncbi:hypothetical protein WA538_000273 [Blastocystis sp. DL]
MLLNGVCASSSPLLCRICNTVNQLSVFSHLQYKPSDDLLSRKQLRGMKEKKAHEVLQICPFLHSIWESHHVNTIVDIGAGQGYISEFLAREYQYSVIGVETQSQLVEKVNRQKATDHFHMITYNIFKGLKARDLERLVFVPEQTACKRVCLDMPIPDYGFIGLHCCGDLSASMCRLFIEADAHCRLLSFVGCCYNLLTTSEETQGAIAGFPLSPNVVSVSLSHRARNCIVQNTQFDSVAEMEAAIERLFFRSLLQTVICKHFPEESDAIRFPVGKLHFEYGKTTFYEYVREFFQKKHPESSIPLEEEVNRLYSQSSRSRKLFQGFFVLQSLYPCVIAAMFLHSTICQLLESLIIADRVYFLQTHGARCRVDCVFDRKHGKVNFSSFFPTNNRGNHLFS